jgi:hypothetical protein
MTDSTTAAITHSDPTTLSQFLYTHEKLRNLARGPLPSQIVDEMVHTVCGIAEKVLEAPAADWRELSKKALLMIEELPVDDPDWVDRICESLSGDIVRLSAVEAAE